MQIPKKFFHDRAVLLLLSINTFLALLGVLLILLRLDAGQDGYIVEYRSNLGLSAFKSGGAGTFFSFIIFYVLVLAFHTFLSIRVYDIRRRLSLTVLGFGLLLLLLAVIVSNALLVLR